MRLKPSVVAVLLAFSAAAASAADSDNSVQTIDEANPTQAVGNAPSSSVENAAADETGWQFLNGQTQTAASDDAGSVQQAVSEDSSASGDQSAMTETSSDSDQSAANEEESSGSDQAASTEDSSSDDQTAMSDDSGGGDQSAASEEESGDDQVAQDSVGDDHMAMAEPGTRAGTFKPATLEDFKAATQDKLVIILPTGWQGSVPQLISSLEGQSDAEILILSQDDPDDDSDE